MIYVVATLRIRLGSLAQVLEAAKPCIEATLKEVGCVLYDLHQSLTEPDKLVFVEQWTTREALANHGNSTHLKVWRTAGSPYIVERKVEIITPESVEVR